MLGSFNNWKIIKLTNETTAREEFDVIHKVVLDGMSDSMTSLVQLDNMMI